MNPGKDIQNIKKKLYVPIQYTYIQTRYTFTNLLYLQFTNLNYIYVFFLPWISNRNYSQHIGGLPRETKSIDENLMSVFRTMWNTK